MGKFLAGVILGMAAFAAGIYVYVHYGFMDMSADQRTGPVERLYMTGAMDRYLGRYSAKMSNPLPASDATLIDGIQIYKDDCAFCHGGPEKPVSIVGRSLNPAAPQFLKDTPDMVENENFWITKYGVKMTGMPAWSKVLADTDIWKVTAFLGKMGNLEKLSPAVQAAWKSGGKAEPAVQQNAPAAADQPPQSAPVPEPGHPHQHKRNR